MKLLKWLMSLLIVTSGAACRTAESASDAASANAREQLDAKVSGENISFPPNSLQLSALAVEPCQPRKSAVNHINGRLTWDDSVTVNVFTPVSGRVKAVLAKPGDRVAENATLATVESPDYGQAQADVMHANGDFSLASRALSRERELFQHGAAAQKDVESAEADYARTLAEKQRAAVRLALFGGKSSGIDQLYSLRSTRAGVVVDRNITAGQEIRPDQMLANAPQFFAPLFVITDPTQLWVILDITEKDIAMVRPGLALSITTVAYPGKTFSGEVDVVGDALDAATRTVKVRGHVHNPDTLLKAEMYVKVDVVDQQEALPGVLAPSKAVFMKGDTHYVFVQEAPGMFARRVVAAGSEQDGRTVITEGATEGTPVVTEGCLLLQSLMESKGAA